MNNKTFWGLLIVAAIVLLGWSGARIVEAYQFDKSAGGHLKRAANANTIELAEQELNTALTYIEENNLTEGSPYVLFDTPDKDIGYWYNNLSSSLEELEKVDSSATQLEKTNLLMKLRETLTSQDGENGTSVITPPGISVYPNNLPYMIWGWAMVIMLGIWSGFGIKKLINEI